MQPTGVPLTSKNDAEPSDEAVVARHSKTLMSRLSDLGVAAAKHDSLLMALLVVIMAAYDKNRFRIVGMVSEIVHNLNLQDKPTNTGSAQAL